MSNAPTTFTAVTVGQLEHVTGGFGIGDILGLFGGKAGGSAPLAQTALGFLGNLGGLGSLGSLGSLLGKRPKTKAPERAETQQPAPAAATSDEAA